MIMTQRQLKIASAGDLIVKVVYIRPLCLWSACSEEKFLIYRPATGKRELDYDRGESKETEAIRRTISADTCTFRSK